MYVSVIMLYRWLVSMVGILSCHQGITKVMSRRVVLRQTGHVRHVFMGIVSECIMPLLNVEILHCYHYVALHHRFLLYRRHDILTGCCWGIRCGGIVQHGRDRIVTLRLFKHSLVDVFLDGAFNTTMPVPCRCLAG